MTVPKRLPPSPHSCSKSRSPRRQRAAAKPNQVMKPNSSTKIVSATQFTSFMTFPLICLGFLTSDRGGATLRLLLGGQIDHRRDYGADEDPQELIPVEERNAHPIRFGTVVEGRPQHGDELDEKQQVPPAPFAAHSLCIVHGESLLRSLRPPAARTVFRWHPCGLTA